MVVQREWDTQGRFEWAMDFGFRFSVLGIQSYGEAQIQIDTAIALFEMYPERFSDLPSVIRNPDGTYNRWEVAWVLDHDWSLNTLVAASYLAYLRGIIVEDVQELGFVISDEPLQGEYTITNEQIDKLTIASYNQGWDWVFESLQSYPTMRHRLVAINETIEIDYVQGVWGWRSAIEDELGIDYGYLYERLRTG